METKTHIDHSNDLTDEHYILLGKAIAIARGDDDEWEDYVSKPTWENVSTTRDDLARYVDGHESWRECGGLQEFEVEGHKVVYWDVVQAVKGQRRVSITVIDLGGIRMIDER